MGLTGTAGTRSERDALGAVEVAAGRLWGAQTQRALENFRISDERMPAEIVRALAAVKAACAQANHELGRLPRQKAEAIARAAEEVVAGLHDAEFPLLVWQSGSGTQSNMNLNEVLANRASAILGGPVGEGRLVHPNDDVNLGQSSNDVFPTAMHVAAVEALARRLLPALDGLQRDLAERARAFADVLKIGRTHLQDAVPMTLGQEFSGWAAQLAQAAMRIRVAAQGAHALAIGGTAVGTGLNADPRFGSLVAARLAVRTGQPFHEAGNHFAAQAAHDALVDLHGAIRGLAVALLKIANDVRWLASGPRCGLGELILPGNEPGSSIMPGKINPSQCEALAMACTLVVGNDTAMAMAGAAGHLELNTAKPLIAHLVLQSIRLAADAMESFARHCVRGIEPDRERIRRHVDAALVQATALAPHIGYDRAARIARAAARDGTGIREAALADGVAAEAYDAWVRLEDMVGRRRGSS